MRIVTLLLLFVPCILSCKEQESISSFNTENWDKRKVQLNSDLDLEFGTTYLSVYSQIYSQTEHKTLDFTSTISMRNINLTDTIYVTKAEYHNTKGDVVRTYLKQPIFISPLETVEIIIDEHDQEGGTGGNFIFEWAKHKISDQPYFEAVMVSTSVQQGLSFTTQGKTLSN